MGGRQLLYLTTFDFLPAEIPLVSSRLLLLARIFFLVCWFALFTSSAIGLADEANEALFSFEKALVGQHSADEVCMSQAVAMLKQLARPELWLTGWRYFYVDKSAVLSAVSAICTYFVLILEFNPRAKSVLQRFARD